MALLSVTGISRGVGAYEGSGGGHYVSGGYDSGHYGGGGHDSGHYGGGGHDSGDRAAMMMPAPALSKEATAVAALISRRPSARPVVEARLMEMALVGLRLVVVVVVE